MTRLLAIIAWPWHLLRGCSCDPRFVGVAHEISCHVHGVRRVSA